MLQRDVYDPGKMHYVVKNALATLQPLIQNRPVLNFQDKADVIFAFQALKQGGIPYSNEEVLMELRRMGIHERVASEIAAVAYNPMKYSGQVRPSLPLNILQQWIADPPPIAEDE